MVSEETGGVSLILDGALERNLDAERLRARLKSLVTLRRTLSTARTADALS